MMKHSLRKSLHRRQTVAVNLAVEVKSKDIGHSRYIIKYRLYSFIEYGRFYVVLPGYAVDEKLRVCFVRGGDGIDHQLQ